MMWIQYRKHSRNDLYGRPAVSVQNSNTRSSVRSPNVGSRDALVLLSVDYIDGRLQVADCVGIARPLGHKHAASAKQLSIASSMHAEPGAL